MITTSKKGPPTSFAAAAASAAAASKASAEFDRKAAKSAEHKDEKRHDDLSPSGADVISGAAITGSGTAGAGSGAGGTVKSVRNTWIEGNTGLLWLSAEEEEWRLSPLPPQEQDPSGEPASD